jgi:hypothetical protein
MKRDLLRMMIPVVWGFLLPGIGLGQTPIDRMDQHTDIVHYDEVFPLGEDAWLFAGRGNIHGGQPSAMYFLCARTDSGDLLWELKHDLMPASYWGNTSTVRAKKISVLQDDGVVIVGVVDGCDVVTGQSAVTRLDNDGEPVWQLEFTFSDFNHIPGSHAGIFDRLADGFSAYHAIASQDSIISLNDEGEILHRWLSPASPVHCMRWENDTILLVGAGNGVFRTRIDGTVLSSLSLEGAEHVMDIRKDGDRVLGLTSDQIAVLSDELQFSHWIPTPAETYGFVDADDEVWLSAGGVLHRIEENALTQLLETGTEAMAYRDSVVMTASSAGHHGRSGGRMKSYLMEDGTNVNHEDDVELLATVDSVSSSQYYSPVFSAIYTFRAHTTVKVVNHSGNILDKVLLSYFAQYGMAFCGTPGQSIIADNLNLAPGDTATIPFSNIYLTSGPMTENSIHSMELCLVAVSPDDHLDIYPDDNQWCDEVTFTVPIGIDEIASPEKMKAFPNPTTGIVFLPNANGSMLEVMDATGRRIALSQLTSDRIDLRGMGVSEGVYLLRLDSGDTGKVARVILTTP